jgi:hypothetical protein
LDLQGEIETKGGRCKERRVNGRTRINAKNQIKYILSSCHCNAHHDRNIPKLLP